MKIAVCDDDKNNILQVESYVRKYCEDNHIEGAQILTFPSAVELLEAYPQDLDILLMDVQMPGTDGIEVAREIRTHDENVVLIYMTNYEKYAIEGYSVQAYGYLLKPVTYDILSHELASAFTLVSRRRVENISLRGEEGYLIIPIRDIDLIETEGKYVRLYIREQPHLIYQSMKQMEELMKGKNFFRVHTAYMVSFACIQKIGKDSVILKSGKELPLSRHRKKEFMEKYMDYIGGQL